MAEFCIKQCSYSAEHDARIFRRPRIAFKTRCTDDISVLIIVKDLECQCYIPVCNEFLYRANLEIYRHYVCVCRCLTQEKFMNL